MGEPSRWERALWWCDRHAFVVMFVAPLGIMAVAVLLWWAWPASQPW